jgi:LTXXQ motif family protein
MTNPRNFAAHRHFADNRAFRPFFHRGWHWHHHLGWIGPLFWPYAYGDFFFYSLWPVYYADIDPVWVYGYGDIYEGIFSPYDYSDYVQGPRAQQRMTELTQSVAQSCTDEADEVVGWPIDRIHDAVQPDDRQNALLDDLGNAVVKASDTIRSHCPTAVSFTPTGRIDTMHERLTGLVQAVDLVTGPLASFYDSLSDEQKARFNDMAFTDNKRGAPKAHTTGAPAAPLAECGAAPMAWPAEQINRVVQPTDAQRGKLDALQAAAANAADMVKAACPSETPSTPPSRLEAVSKRLHAMLQAVETVRPALADFYNALSDDQKAHFNTMGRQLFSQQAQE